MDRRQHYDLRPKQRLGSIPELCIRYYHDLGLPYFCFVLGGEDALIFLYCFQSDYVKERIYPKLVSQDGDVQRYGLWTSPS